jgi:hypothetical protein
MLGDETSLTKTGKPACLPGRLNHENGFVNLAIPATLGRHGHLPAISRFLHASGALSSSACGSHPN